MFMHNLGEFPGYQGSPRHPYGQDAHGPQAGRFPPGPILGAIRHYNCILEYPGMASAARHLEFLSSKLSA